MTLNTKEVLNFIKEAKRVTGNKATFTDFDYIFITPMSDNKIILECVNKDNQTIETILDCVDPLITNINFFEFEKFIKSSKSENITITKDKFIDDAREQDFIFQELDKVDTIEQQIKKDIVVHGAIKDIDLTININTQIVDNVDKNNPKYELNGMLIDFKNGKLVSTNTRALTVQDITIPEELKGLSNAIIPKNMLFDTMQLIKINNKFLVFKNGNNTFKTDFISGKYPDYQRIMLDDNSQYSIKIKFNFDDIKEHIKKHNGTVLFEFANNTLTPILIHGENETRLKSINCMYPSDTIFKIAFNSELMKIINYNNIEMIVRNPNSPFKIRESGSDTERIIMPVILGKDAYFDVRKIKNDFMQDSSNFIYNTKKQVIKKVTKKLSLPNGEQKRILQLESELENLQSEVERLKAIISQRATYYKNVA